MSGLKCLQKGILISRISIDAARLRGGTLSKVRFASKLQKARKGELTLKNDIPPAVEHRVSYEYPPPPKTEPELPKESSSWRRHLPLLMGVGGLVWAVYAYNYIFNPSEGEQTILTPEKFSKFRITYKEQIADDVQLIELSPKYAQHLDLLQSGGSLWNGKKLWSIQIKHPDIQIARKYTPLPLYYMQSNENGEHQALLRMLGDSPDEGRFVLIVKKYDDGEMSRYLHNLPIGSDVEIRGPYIEHKFPYTHADMEPMRMPMLDVPTRMKPESDDSNKPKADNIVFFTGGTGLAPALQCLLSRNPPRGFTSVYHSSKKADEIPLERFRLFLERVGRAKFNIFLDEDNRFISAEDLPSPVDRQPRALSSKPADSTTGKNSESTPKNSYRNIIQQASDKSRVSPYVSGVALAVVCGPPGYMSFVSGDPGPNNDAPISGLLGAKGWDSTNVKRMSEW